MSQKQSGGIVFRILNIALPIIIAVAAAYYISHVSVLNVSVEASLDGQVLGYVSSYEDVVEARNSIMSAVSNATNKSYIPDINVDYELVHTKSTNLLSKEEIAELIWEGYSDSFCEAYMLYVDGEQVAAHQSQSALENLIWNIRIELLESKSYAYENVEITNDIQIVKQLCLKSMLRTTDEINALLNPLSDEPVPKRLDTSSASTAHSMQIGALYLASPKASGSGIPSIDSFTSASDESDTSLTYTFISTETVNEIIYHTTKYINDDTTLVGRDKLICEGSDGEKTVTYAVFYDDTGTVVGREVLSETVITPVVDTVVKVGTRPIPDTVPLGYFIWPCATPKGISSPYGPRVVYGVEEFHLGIDLPDKKGSPIYAADGGTVIWAGTTPSYGNSIRIMHNDGYETLYAHLDTMVVAPGDKVYQGQLIGTMGTTGVSYGTHLHFEVRINGKTYDPEDYLPELVIGD